MASRRFWHPIDVYVGVDHYLDPEDGTFDLVAEAMRLREIDGVDRYIKDGEIKEYGKEQG